MRNTIILFLIILVNARLSRAQEPVYCSAGTTKKTVAISNRLPQNSVPFAAYCGGDKNLGNHTIGVNKFFLWDFCEDNNQSSFYSCHFYWGSKEQSLILYSKYFDKKFCQNGKCSWSARADGIYIYENKFYDWVG